MSIRRHLAEGILSYWNKRKVDNGAVCVNWTEWHGEMSCNGKNTNQSVSDNIVTHC